MICEAGWAAVGRPARRSGRQDSLADPVRPTVVVLAFMAGACATAPAAVAAPPARQQVVRLLGAHGVRATPVLDARRVASVNTRRAITGVRTVLPVLGRSVDGDGREWLRVRLPGRTLGHRPPPRSGWISASHTRRSSSAWHVVVEVGSRRVLVDRAGRVLRRYRAIVGKPPTPTPRGDYFVEENVRLGAEFVGAPFALALSARSRVLQEFDGGPGQIALQGLGNVGGQLGSAVSHGCVRLADDAITWLAAHLEPGVPVTIR
jgi:L,D-transpeptidase catalytic domain